ncbi:MAG TPA: family 20 glycosylhydrolase [Rhodanobacteraceae bacterium]|nr:family 20 glycosylhydrolase [Rhodanobacteraceae bacterium]
MFRTILLLAAALVLLAACAPTPRRTDGKIAQVETPSLSLIPWPASVARARGLFVLRNGANIVVSPGSDEALQVARRFDDLLAETHGMHLAFASNDAQTNAAIVFTLDPSIENDEGYTLDVSPQRIRIAARDPRGLFYGAVTLWQLLTQDANSASVISVPCLHIEDHPRFRWRGLMLDSARHYQPIAVIEKLLDQMALHKLNRFQWHLTDDQGWRIAIARYPELTKIGAWRTPVGPDVALANGDGKYGGYYTPEQIREIVAYAAARYITVVPEIEMPGHATAAIASYPQFGVTGKRPPVSSDWGVHTTLYNIDDRTFDFLDNVLDEVMALFPSPYIHIGGDEAVKDQWQASTKIQRKMRALGIENEDALQAWFVARIGKHISARGRTLVGWDEILQGGLPQNAVVMSWRGAQGAVEAAKLGHDAVMSPSPQMYFDHLQSDLPDEPTGRPTMVSLKDVYDFEPVPKELDAQQARHVLGAQANLWSEYLTTPARVEHATFPRIDALAEVSWSPADARDWDGFLARMPAQLARYRTLGIGYSDDAFAAKIDVQPTADANTARVALSNQTGLGAIRYTLDGSEPNARSAVYHAPLEVKLPATVRARTFAGGVSLAASRARTLDPQSLLRLRSDQLQPCTNDLPLRLEDGAGEAGTFFNIDLLDPCWIYPRLDLSNIDRIDLRIGTVPNNFQLWHDAAKIVTRPAHSPAGELEIHQDTCDGLLLASISMKDVPRGKLDTVSAPVSAQGTHDLCLFFTGRSPRYLRAIQWISPVPASY